LRCYTLEHSSGSPPQLAAFGAQALVAGVSLRNARADHPPDLEPGYPRETPICPSFEMVVPWSPVMPVEVVPCEAGGDTTDGAVGC